MDKRPMIKSIWDFVLFFVVIFFLAGCSNKVEEKTENREPKIHSSSNTNRDTTLYVVPGKKAAEEMETMMKTDSFKRINEWGNHINQGIRYEQAKNYEQAEIEFKKAIEADRSDQGVPRRGLVRVYETTGQYQLALDQIDWLIQRTSRKDVLDELLTRKQKLEQLLSKKID